MGAVDPNGGGGALVIPSSTPGAGTVGASQLASNAVTKVKVADDAIGADELDGADATAIRALLDVPSNGEAILDSLMTTDGDIITRVAGVPARLAMGTALQGLRVNAGATALEYADAASGLPTASAADEFPASTGAGTTYTARTTAQVLALINAARTTTFQLAATGSWSLGQPSGGSVTVAGGAITTVLPVGSLNSAGAAIHAWPAGVGQLRYQARYGLTSANTSANIVLRSYIDYGSLSPYIAIELTAAGGLNVSCNGTPIYAGTSQPLTGSLWVRVEVVASRVDLYTCVNASDDATLCVWVWRATGAVAAIAGKSAPAQIFYNVVSEGFTTTATVTTTVRDVTACDLSK